MNIQLSDLGQYLKIGSNEPTSGQWTDPDGTVHHIDPAYLKPDPNWTGAAPTPYINPAIANDPPPTPPPPPSTLTAPLAPPPPTASSGITPTSLPAPSSPSVVAPGPAQPSTPFAPGGGSGAADAKALIDLQAQIAQLNAAQRQQTPQALQPQPIFLQAPAPPSAQAAPDFAAPSLTAQPWFWPVAIGAGVVVLLILATKPKPIIISRNRRNK